MIKNILFPLAPFASLRAGSELVEGRSKYTAMVRQAHHERFLYDF